MQYLVDFTPHAIDPIGIGVVRVVVHSLAQHPRELVVHRVRESGERGAAVRLHEPPVDVIEERVRVHVVPVSNCRAVTMNNSRASFWDRSSAMQSAAMPSARLTWNTWTSCVYDTRAPPSGRRSGTCRAVVLRQHHAPTRHHRVLDPPAPHRGRKLIAILSMVTVDFDVIHSSKMISS
jgi:hypothetical protein